MLPVKLDHCVIHVTDSERANSFYTKVMGADLIARPVARIPVAHGNGDLCFEWIGPIADAISHLEHYGISVESGPLGTFGAKGPGTSIYFRDPDGSLMEFIACARSDR